jgi:hypothetical protein
MIVADINRDRPRRHSSPLPLQRHVVANEYRNVANQSFNPIRSITGSEEYSFLGIPDTAFQCQLLIL